MMSPIPPERLSPVALASSSAETTPRRVDVPALHQELVSHFNQFSSQHPDTSISIEYTGMTPPQNSKASGDIQEITIELKVRCLDGSKPFKTLIRDFTQQAFSPYGMEPIDVYTQKNETDFSHFTMELTFRKIQPKPAA